VSCQASSNGSRAARTDASIPHSAAEARECDMSWRSKEAVEACLSCSIPSGREWKTNS
jgi:hypothetical protein